MDVNSKPDFKSKEQNSLKSLRRSIHKDKIFIRTETLWERLYKLRGHFNVVNSTEFLILQKIILGGEKRQSETCISDARFESKDTLAESFGVSPRVIKNAEYALRKKNLIISTGQESSFAKRQIALHHCVINFLLGKPKPFELRGSWFTLSKPRQLMRVPYLGTAEPRQLMRVPYLGTEKPSQTKRGPDQGTRSVPDQGTHSIHLSNNFNIHSLSSNVLCTRNNDLARQIIRNEKTKFKKMEGVNLSRIATHPLMEKLKQGKQERQAKKETPPSLDPAEPKPTTKLSQSSNDLFNKYKPYFSGGYGRFDYKAQRAFWDRAIAEDLVTEIKDAVEFYHGVDKPTASRRAAELRLTDVEYTNHLFDETKAFKQREDEMRRRDEESEKRRKRLKAEVEKRNADPVARAARQEKIRAIKALLHPKKVNNRL